MWAMFLPAIPRTVVKVETAFMICLEFAGKMVVSTRHKTNLSQEESNALSSVTRFSRLPYTTKAVMLDGPDFLCAEVHYKI